MNDLKKELDKEFDTLFFNKDFINKVVKKFKICPNGLTIDTRFTDNNDPYLVCCCKEYGYEYSHENVIGDYIITRNYLGKDYSQFCFDYIKENNLELYNKIKDIDFYI